MANKFVSGECDFCDTIYDNVARCDKEDLRIVVLLCDECARNLWRWKGYLQEDIRPVVGEIVLFFEGNDIESKEVQKYDSVEVDTPQRTSEDNTGDFTFNDWVTWADSSGST